MTSLAKAFKNGTLTILPQEVIYSSLNFGCDHLLCIHVIEKGINPLNPDFSSIRRCLGQISYHWYAVIVDRKA